MAKSGEEVLGDWPVVAYLRVVAIDAEEVLRKVRDLNVMSWNYIGGGWTRWICCARGFIKREGTLRRTGLEAAF